MSATRDPRPATLQELTDMRYAFQEKVAALDKLIARHLHHSPIFDAMPGAGAKPGDRAVDIKQAAAMLSTSTDSLYRKRKRLGIGYIDPLDGRVKFTERELHEYLRRLHQ